MRNRLDPRRAAQRETIIERARQEAVRNERRRRNLVLSRRAA